MRIAGACWPFGWTSEIVWQVCFEKERLIAAAIFLQARLLLQTVSAAAPQPALGRTVRALRIPPHHRAHSLALLSPPASCLSRAPPRRCTHESAITRHTAL